MNKYKGHSHPDRVSFRERLMKNAQKKDSESRERQIREEERLSEHYKTKARTEMSLTEARAELEKQRPGTQSYRDAFRRELDARLREEGAA
ncbi:hypothetical protein E2F43_10805 [Seongchinamella unica]|uniref:Uncharacterized protein n=1 Tax=Seongchinamella unica TaxID=2547392 RepID=A0A4R5LSR7_9GAMM|nr:hypothetical protein [Seongchinamella unica]TDG13975.1 hypothetical protein E2F43_10805 [Seongchinamella unica]